MLTKKKKLNGDSAARLATPGNEKIGDTIGNPSIIFSRDENNKDKTSVTIVLGFEQIANYQGDSNNPEPSKTKFRDILLDKDFFKPGMFEVNFEKNGDSTDVVIKFTLPTKIPGTGPNLEDK